MTDSAVQIVHLPTGLRVRTESERSQHQNKAAGLSLLRAKLAEHQRMGAKSKRDNDRRQQIGSGMRGDKIRTIALQRGTVTDHRTGKTISAKAWLRGDLSGL